MNKSSLSQKTRVKKVLLAILHHNKNLDLNKFLKKIDSNKLYFLLIVVDGRFNFKIQKKIKNKIIFKKKNKNAIPINRNIAINYAIKKKFDLILFLDSDIIPSHNIVLNHIKAHKKYNNFVGIGGPVKPSFKLQKFNLWEFLDGKACPQSTEISETNFNENKKIVGIIDLMGRDTELKENIPLFIIYADGTVKKTIKLSY